MKSKTSLLALCALSLALPARAATLVRDGKAVAKIYMPPLAEAPAPVENKRAPVAEAPLAMAARELNYHLQKISGTAMESATVADAGAIRGPAIVLGASAVSLGAKPQKTSPNKEGFRILVKGEQILIGGESDEAVLLGTYALLEKLGCDWVMPGEIGEIIPQKSTVEIGAMDESQAPDFQVRGLWYRGGSRINTKDDDARFIAWQRRQKGARTGHVATTTGGHVWDQFIKRHKAEFDKDPTMYALVRDPKSGDMVRRGPQLESTHPRVVALFVEEIKAAFAKNNWPKDKMTGFGIGPADGMGYSQSVESLGVSAGRIDPIVGELDRTDELILLGNTILEKLGAEYPNVLLGFYSYSVHGDYPTRYKPNPRIVQIFAPINFSRFHSVLDLNSKTQSYYKSVVEKWGKLSREQGNLLFYRGYNWNLAENMLPYSKLRIWGEELPFYKAQNVAGLSVEATKAWSVNGPSDYVFMKLAWNTSQNWKTLLADYCRKSFGAGAAPMERYFLRLTETQHNSGQEAGSYQAFHLIYDDAFIATGERDMAQAAQAATEAAQKTRIAHFADGLAALKLYLNYHRATLAFDFVAAKAAHDAMGAHWQKQYDTNTDLVAKEVPGYLKRYIVDFAEQSVKYSTGEYRIVDRLPDALPTMLDPNSVGQHLNFHRAEINDSGFNRTKTISTTWDAQGLAGMRAGAVWYRHHFQVAAADKGKPIGLFLGGFEDEARVWINGVLIGTSGQRFSMPAEFDLTEGIKYDGDNVVAIEVVRNSAANEIGLGGLIRPSFLFTGPRLEIKAPKPLELRRVLPGGELGEILK